MNTTIFIAGILLGASLTIAGLICAAVWLIADDDADEEHGRAVAEGERPGKISERGSLHGRKHNR